MPTEATPVRRYGLFDWTMFACFALIMLWGATISITGIAPDTGFAILFTGALGVVVGRLLRQRGAHA
jgi:hypothetical protein